MSKLTQEELVMQYLREHGSITPARMGGHIYRNQMFGSEVSRTCRRLRADARNGVRSERDGKFTRFYLAQKKVEEAVEHIVSQNIDFKKLSFSEGVQQVKQISLFN